MWVPGPSSSSESSMSSEALAEPSSSATILPPQYILKPLSVTWAWVCYFLKIQFDESHSDLSATLGFCQEPSQINIAVLFAGLETQLSEGKGLRG